MRVARFGQRAWDSVGGYHGHAAPSQSRWREPADPVWQYVTGLVPGAQKTVPPDSHAPHGTRRALDARRTIGTIACVENIVTVTLHAAIDRIVEVRDFKVGAHLPGRLIARIPAGKGVNVSRALAMLGVSSVATGFVGREQLADYETSAATTGDVSFQPQFLALDGPTRENITIVEGSTGAETHIRDTGPAPTDTDLERLSSKLNLLTRPDSLVVFSGSLPPGVDPKYVTGLIDLALSKGAKVAVDGPGRLLAEVTDRSLWLIKPNDPELAEMGRTELLTDAQIIEKGRMLNDNIRTVIVSRGSAGGYLFIDGSAMMGQIDLDPERVVSTVGCGDCMMAAFIAAQCRGDDVRQSYRYALAVASAAALDVVPGRFDLATVEELLGKTSVEPV